MARSKTDRHNKILELIAQHEIETQGELLSLLVEAGFLVTQATVSRDIRELKAVKANISIGEGRHKYAVIPQRDATGITDKSIRILTDGIVSMKCAQNIVVIKTLEGFAMGVAACVDALEEPDVIGTIAGDDTIFCIVQNNKRGGLLIKKLHSIIKG